MNIFRTIKFNKMKKHIFLFIASVLLFSCRGEDESDIALNRDLPEQTELFRSSKQGVYELVGIIEGGEEVEQNVAWKIEIKPDQILKDLADEGTVNEECGVHLEGTFEESYTDEDTGELLTYTVINRVASETNDIYIVEQIQFTESYVFTATYSFSMSDSNTIRINCLFEDSEFPDDDETDILTLRLSSNQSEDQFPSDCDLSVIWY